MRRLLLIFTLFLTTPAQASFLQPQCVDVSAGRFDRAEVVGIGTVTDIDCKCAGNHITCDKTLFLNQLTKGDAPLNVHVFETFDLDFQTTASYCREAEAGIRHHVGEKEVYFLQKAKKGYTALPAQRCLPEE